LYAFTAAARFFTVNRSGNCQIAVNGDAVRYLLNRPDLSLQQTR
jgi:hypothetical protein